MQGEFKRAERVMRLHIVDRGIIVNIVNVNLKFVILLEVVLDRDLLHPLWRQVIVDNFSLTDFGPLISCLLVHKENRIRFRKGIHIR